MSKGARRRRKTSNEGDSCSPNDYVDIFVVDGEGYPVVLDHARLCLMVVIILILGFNIRAPTRLIRALQPKLPHITKVALPEKISCKHSINRESREV